MSKLNGDKYCIFGITRWGMIIGYDLISSGKKVVFSDNNPKMYKKDFIENCDCISPSDIGNEYRCIVAVRSEANKKSIYDQLVSQGIKDIILLNGEIMATYEKTVEDEPYLKAIWYMRMGYELDFDRPRTFNEKLQWLKIHDRRPEYTQMVDKYEVKKYLANIIGEEYIIPAYGVWNDFDEIDFNTLPERFVLKCTHDSGSVVICEDKRKLDLDFARQKLNDALRRNFYYVFREWPYKNVKPRIIAEQYLENTEGKLNDYKIHLFKGEPVFIQYICDRDIEKHTACQRFFTPEWEDTGWTFEDFPMLSGNAPKPKNLDLMLSLAKKIAGEKNYIRVDLYDTDEQVFFGEATYYPLSGLYDHKGTWDESKDLEIGEMIDLSGVG